jgi:hypothetical protein
MSLIGINNFYPYSLTGLQNITGTVNGFTPIVSITIAGQTFYLTASTPDVNGNVVLTLNIATATTSTTGLLTDTDWNTFNSKENGLTFNSPLNRVIDAISFDFSTTNTFTGINDFNGAHLSASGRFFVRNNNNDVDAIQIYRNQSLFPTEYLYYDRDGTIGIVGGSSNWSINRFGGLTVSNVSAAGSNFMGTLNVVGLMECGSGIVNNALVVRNVLDQTEAFKVFRNSFQTESLTYNGFTGTLLLAGGAFNWSIDRNGLGTFNTVTTGTLNVTTLNFNNLNITGNNVIQFGVGIAKETNAGKIGYQFASTNLDIVGAGTVNGQRGIRLWDRVGINTNPTTTNGNECLYLGGDIVMNDRGILFRTTGDTNHTIEFNNALDGVKLSGFQGVEISTKINGERPHLRCTQPFPLRVFYDPANLNNNIFVNSSGTFGRQSQFNVFWEINTQGDSRFFSIVTTTVGPNYLGAGSQAGTLGVAVPNGTNLLNALTLCGITNSNGVIQVVCNNTRARNIDGACYRASNDGNHIINFENTGGGLRGRIQGAGAGGVSYFTTSDRRLKKNFRDMPTMIDTIMKMKPLEYEWISDNRTEAGFVAQDIHKIFPLLKPAKSSFGSYCKCGCDGCDSDTCKCDCDNFDEENPIKKDGTIYPLALDYGLFTPYLTKALQEVIVKVETLEDKVQTLEAENKLLNDIIERITKIEDKLFRNREVLKY